MLKDGNQHRCTSVQTCTHSQLQKNIEKNDDKNVLIINSMFLISNLMCNTIQMNVNMSLSESE